MVNFSFCNIFKENICCACFGWIRNFANSNTGMMPRNSGIWCSFAKFCIHLIIISIWLEWTRNFEVRIVEFLQNFVKIWQHFVNIAIFSRNFTILVRNFVSTLVLLHKNPAQVLHVFLFGTGMLAGQGRSPLCSPDYWPFSTPYQAGAGLSS
jgi:hypothetical protein